MQLRRWVNNYPQYWYKLHFNKNRKLIITSFFNTVPLLFNAFLPSLHKLIYALRKKRFWLNSEPPIAASFSSWSEMNRRTPWVDQTGDSLNGRDRDYTEGEPIFQTWVSGGFRSRGQQYLDGYCHATTQCLLTVVLGVCFEFRLQPVNKHIAVTSTVYCWTSVLIVFQYWALWVPKTVSINFPADCWLLNFFLIGDCGCFHSILCRLHSGS